MAHTLSQEELIAHIAPCLKERGFKKKNKRWTRDAGEFILVFFIQGSAYSKDNYYIRPEVIIKALSPESPTYSHGVSFGTELEQKSAEQVMADFEKFCLEWTDKALIKERCEAFVRWDERNPLENRRAKLVDYEADPVPSHVFFRLHPNTIKYILDNF